MIVYTVNVAVAVVLIVAAFFRPGVGIGVALVLGRHTFPDRVTPIIAAAPLLCFSALLGYRLSGRRLQLSTASVVGVLLTAGVVVVGGFRPSTNETVRALADDKSFFLVAAVVPLLLLVNTLRDRDVRLDFVRSLVGISFLLTLVVITSGGGERAGAFGGGPITLATSIGISIIILVHHHANLLPSELSAFENPFRIGVGLIFGYGIILTQSRQPVLSLILVLGLGSVAGLSRDRAHSAGPLELKRIRRMRALSVAAIGIATMGLVQLIFGSSNSRFTLLADPGQEIARGRSIVWDAGLEMARTAGIFGHGFGATARVDAPEVIPYPHNIFLELFAEVGPMMTVIVTGALITIGIHAALSGNRVFSLLSAYTLIGAQFSGDLYNSRYVFIFLIAAAVVPPRLDTDRSTFLPQTTGSAVEVSAPGLARLRSGTAAAPIATKIGSSRE